MNKIILILSFIIIVPMLLFNALPIVSAFDDSNAIIENIPICELEESVTETLNNSTGFSNDTLPIVSAFDDSNSIIDNIPISEPEENTIGKSDNSTALSKKLPTLDGLIVIDNCFSWNPISQVRGYHVRIVGIDRVTRTIVDSNYEIADHPYFSLPELNQGEYLLLVKAKSTNQRWNSDWAEMEYRIGVEASNGVFEDCHNDWSGFYEIFESTEETEGLEARYCLTCLKTHVIRNAALPSGDEWMVFKLNNDGKGYLVRAHSVYSEKPYEEVVIPAYHKGKPVTEIGNLGFYRMLNLKTVVIPNTVNKIGDGAFAHCSNLQTISVDKDNAYYKFEDGCLIEIESNKVLAGTNTCIIPNYITGIGSHAFYALKMTSFFIPASVKDVGDGIFCDCTELKSVVFGKESQLERISFSMFGGCKSLENIILPNSIKSIELAAFGGCTSIKSLILPSCCKNIEEFAFGGWTSSQTVYITAFASKAEAENAFDANWDFCDRDGQICAEFIFLPKD